MKIRLQVPFSLLLACFFTVSLLSACKKSASKENQPSSEQDSNVEGWYFRVVSGYPMSITYEPIVLFKDGQYVEVGDQPLEDMDPEQDKKERPSAWGTWEKQDDTYYLTNSGGYVADYRLGTGSWFPAYPYTEEIPLAKAYENTSGGDFGNGTSALFQTRIDFPEAGYFYHKSNAGVLTPGSTGWSQSADAGTYSIQGHTITLRYNGGEEVRLSFAVGAKGNPANPNGEMLFIGGEVFVSE